MAWCSPAGQLGQRARCLLRPARRPCMPCSRAPRLCTADASVALLPVLGNCCRAQITRAPRHRPLLRSEIFRARAARRTCAHTQCAWRGRSFEGSASPARARIQYACLLRHAWTRGAVIDAKGRRVGAPPTPLRPTPVRSQSQIRQSSRRRPRMIILATHASARAGAGSHDRPQHGPLSSSHHVRAHGGDVQPRPPSRMLEGGSMRYCTECFFL